MGIRIDRLVKVVGLETAGSQGADRGPALYANPFTSKVAEGNKRTRKTGDK